VPARRNAPKENPDMPSTLEAPRRPAARRPGAARRGPPPAADGLVPLNTPPGQVPAAKRSVILSQDGVRNLELATALFNRYSPVEMLAPGSTGAGSTGGVSDAREARA
jgi:hypothetical protein